MVQRYKPPWEKGSSAGIPQDAVKRGQRAPKESRGDLSTYTRLLRNRGEPRGSRRVPRFGGMQRFDSCQYLMPASRSCQSMDHFILQVSYVFLSTGMSLLPPFQVLSSTPHRHGARESFCHRFSTAFPWVPHWHHFATTFPPFFHPFSIVFPHQLHHVTRSTVVSTALPRVSHHFATGPLSHRFSTDSASPREPFHSLSHCFPLLAAFPLLFHCFSTAVSTNANSESTVVSTGFPLAFHWISVASQLRHGQLV